VEPHWCLERRARLDVASTTICLVPSFVVLRLIASGHFAGLEVAIPNGSVGWVEWRPRGRHPVEYQGKPEGRLTLRLNDGFDEREANWIAEVISALLDLIHGPSGMRLAVAEVDEQTFEHGLDGAEVAQGFDVLDERRADADDGWWPTDDPIRILLIALPAVLGSAAGDHDQGLPAAALYYKLSTSEFAFLGDSVTWALSEAGRGVPESAFDRQRVEQAFHNAFKALEALVGGEPSSDERRFRDRLARVGVDVDEPVAFRSLPREPLIEVLKRVRATRDARAAHAGRTSAARRGISYYELMEAQYAAATALTHAVLKVAPEAGERPH
jgi:hypothetical protein